MPNARSTVANFFGSSMRRIKRYPLLRQEAFNDDAQDESEKSDIESPIPLDFPKNIYMVHPDLICIFNTVTSEGKSEDSAVVKKCESSEDVTTPTQPVVLGGSIIFSNSCDGYISPTLIEKYESLASDLSADKENLSNCEACHDQGPVTEDVGANQDIISFSTAPSRIAIESSVVMSEKPADTDGPVLDGPYISPHNKDVITFFLTEIGRQKTIEKDTGFEGFIPTETVGETTPDCTTSEENNEVKETNKDIISFLTDETKEESSRKMSYSLSVPSPKSKADLRKPYISLNFSDIISFYNSEESLLHACSLEPEQPQCDLPDESDAEDEDVDPSDKENIPVNNPDQLVFRNDPSTSVSAVVTSTPKRSAVKRKTPMMIHKGSVISFYSNEESFLSALEVSSVELEARDSTVREESPDEAESLIVEKDYSYSKENDEIDVIETDINVDIKVFSNRSYESSSQKIETAPSHSPLQPRKSNSVLVVTEEFPDIISFYNPGADDSAVQIPEGAKQEIENSIRRENSMSVDTAEFGMIELPQSNDGLRGTDQEVTTAPDQEPFIIVNNFPEEDSGENRDTFVFRNDRSTPLEKELIGTSSEVQVEKKQAPMMVHQGSVITFYCNESSFLAAMDPPQSEPHVETIEGDINGVILDVTEGNVKVSDVSVSNNVDIKVYTNKVLDLKDVIDDDIDATGELLPDIVEVPVQEEAQIQEAIEEDTVKEIPEIPIEELKSEEQEPLVHIVDMNGHEQDSDYDDDMPGLEECPDSIHESDESERQDSLVVVEDSVSEDGKPIRKVQDIEDLPSIERAIDMVNAIGGVMDVDKDLDINVSGHLEDDYLYDDEEFEKDITEEIDSLISEAEQLMVPNETDDCDALTDDLDKFFDEVSDPEELLLRAEPDEVPQLQIRGVSQNGDPETSPRDSSSESAIINFITQNIDKYMENSPGMDVSLSFIETPPNDMADTMEDAGDVIAGFDELLDVEDCPDIPGCETPEPPLSKTPTPQPSTPVATRHLLRSASFDAEGNSDEEYNTLFEALNKPLLPPIPRVLCEDDDDEILSAKSLTTLEDYLPKGTSKSSQLTNSRSYDCDGEGKVLSTGLLSEIVQHPLAARAGSLKRSASSGDHPGRISASPHQDPLDEAHLFFLQNNIGVSSRDGRVEEKTGKKDEESKDEAKLSPISSLAQTISERLTAHMGGASGAKTIKPSDVVKFDKNLFGELQKKFNKPKEKMSSFRSKYKNRKKTANKWVPVQVIPDQVDISYDEVNPVDVEVTIPDLTERRTPIAKLFNDTSPPLAKSPSPPVRIVSPRPNVFVPIESPSAPHRRRFPSPKILRKVAMFEGLALIDSRRRPVSPGPESKYLGSVENIAEPGESHDCECETHPGKLTKQSRSWVSQDSGLYDGTLKPVSARKPTGMFQPTWRKDSPDRTEERPRSTSPYCQSFSEAAFGVNGNYIDNHVPDSVRHPSRSRNLSSDSNRENRMVQSSIASQTNTHVDRLARSGSAASLAVVMASTFPNGGDPNFDLAGTAAKISQVCKSLSNSQSDIASCGVNLTRSRSVNSGIDVIHNSEAKRPSRPIYYDRNSSAGIRIRRTPENRVGQPVKPKKAIATYREILRMQEELKDAEIISYQDLVRCPRNKLPPHVDKLQLQKYLSDTEFVDVFKMPKEEFNKMAPWKQANLKKNVSLY